MLKVSNSELIALMKDKKVVQMLEQDKKEDRQEELFRKQIISSLQDVVKSLSKEVTHSETDLSPLVSAIQEVAKAQMEMCKMMGKPAPNPKVKQFNVNRDITSEITSITVEYS